MSAGLISKIDWSLVLSGGALLVAILAYLHSRTTAAKQIELQKSQAKLAEFQHKALTAQQQAARLANLQIQLVREGRNSRFIFSNEGPAAALNVTFTFFDTGLRKTPALIPSQYDEVFPIAEFRPGDTYPLAAVLTLDMPSVLEGAFSWTDVDGNVQELKRRVVL